MRYWLESVRMLQKYPPRFHDIWTYAGVACMCGVFTGIIRGVIMYPLMRGYHNDTRIMAAAALTFCLVWLMLKKMGLHSSFFMTVGGVCMGVPFWPTYRLTFMTPLLDVCMFVFGVCVSLPLFMREIQSIRPHEQ